MTFVNFILRSRLFMTPTEVIDKEDVMRAIEEKILEIVVSAHR